MRGIAAFDWSGAGKIMILPLGEGECSLPLDALILEHQIPLLSPRGVISIHFVVNDCTSPLWPVKPFNCQVKVHLRMDGPYDSFALQPADNSQCGSTQRY